jgi:hypothetical protein
MRNPREEHGDKGTLPKTVGSLGCMIVAAVLLPWRAEGEVYDLVRDFANLNIPPGANPITQTAGSTWTYQYENSAHHHDGTYTLLTNGWNTNWKGYGLTSTPGFYDNSANVNAVINAADNPFGLPVPNPADANYLQSRAGNGVGSIWEPLVIVWTAPSNCNVAVSITATNSSAAGTDTTTLSLDHWNGAALTVLDSVALPGQTAYTLSAQLNVASNDQIHIWRDSYANQQGVICYAGTITTSAPIPTNVPPPVVGPIVYDLVRDFANLNIPPGANPITQTAGSTWTYQYENSAHHHDGTYTLLTNGWNANYVGYGLTSLGAYSGADVKAIINATDNPAALPVPNPADANYLRSTAGSGVNYIWEPLVIVWTAPSTGNVAVSITATNISAAGTDITTLSLDHWNGAALTVLDSVALAGQTAYALCATQQVAAGDQIHIWRDSYVNQQGVICYAGTITWTPPPPPKGTVISIR